MAKSPAPASEPAPEADAAPAAPAVGPDPFRLTLTEFCARLSEGDRRVELIAAFNYDEEASGRVVDVEDNFRTRFEAFRRRPA